MKKASKIILLILCTALLRFGSVPATPMQNPAPSGSGGIRVVADGNYPPFIFHNEEGQLQGILVDQWALWEQKTGIPVTLTGLPWDEAQAAMKTGEYDVIDTIFESAERLALYDFTQPYAAIEVPVFFSRDLSGINIAESLQGFSVAVKKGDYAIGYLLDHGVISLSEYDNYKDIVEAAAQNRALVFVMDKPPAMYLMCKAGIEDRFRHSSPLYAGQFHRAVKKGDTQLLQLIESGFAMISENEYRQIDEKWRGQEISHLNLLPYAAYASIVLLLVYGLLMLWNRSLKRMVKKRTMELENALEQLRLTESENSAIIKAIPQIVLMMDNNGRFLQCLSTRRGDEIRRLFIGKTVREVFLPSLSRRMERDLAVLKRTGTMQTLEYSIDEAGEIRHYEVILVTCDGSRILAFITDITERKTVALRMYEMSIHDSLTRLHNRNYFEQKIQEFQESGKHGVGCLMCDLDGLKLINDTLGHSEGDGYIRLAAEIIRGCFPENAVLARIGGDEFGVLLPDCSLEMLERKKLKILHMVEQANRKERPMPLSMSLGCAMWDGPDVPLVDVLRDADDSMSRDKLNHMQSIKSKNIELLARMLEARDFITEGHGGRLEEWAGKLAQAAGLSTSDGRDVTLLAKFHDIGKIGISDAILFKPSPLNEDEWIAMRRHTEIGYRIASSSPDLIHIADWILKHHERYDGGGYPFGLQALEIPVQCRIVAILDAFDAMTNDRPYRKAIPVEQAREELRQCAGTQFDPRLAEAFLKILEEEEAERNGVAV